MKKFKFSYNLLGNISNIIFIFLIKKFFKMKKYLYFYFYILNLVKIITICNKLIYLFQKILSKNAKIIVVY